MLLRILIFFSLLFIGSTLLSQTQSISFHRLETLELEKSVASVDSFQHTALKPFVDGDWNTDSIFGYLDEKKYYYPFGRKFLRDHLVEIKGEDFRFSFDPLWDLQLGWDLADTTNFKDSVRIFNNTRGILIQGEIGDKVSFQTSVYENQSRFPVAYQRLIDSLGVVPGQGRVKNNQSAGWDYSSSFGQLSVQALPWMNLQIGHSKHFIGNGYRSMLLSDNAFNYPFIKGTFDFEKQKLRYMWMYANFQILERLPVGDVPESLFRKRGGSFYFLNWNPHPRVELGVYESIMWNEWNDSIGTLPFNYEQLIPVIGVNSLLQSEDTLHQAFLGANLNLKVTNQLQLYGQMMMNFNGTSERAYQLGMKYFDAGVENLDLQLEFNTASARMYNNARVQEDYFHLNQSLAHPLGSNFKEVLAIANYRHKRWFTQVKGHLQAKPSELGVNIDRRSQILDVQTGIFLNPKTNMNLSVGWVFRDLKELYRTEKTQWIYVAFRTSLWNKYYDF